MKTRSVLSAALTTVLAGLLVLLFGAAAAAYTSSAPPTAPQWTPPPECRPATPPASVHDVRGPLTPGTYYWDSPYDDKVRSLVFEVPANAPQLTYVAVMRGWGKWIILEAGEGPLWFDRSTLSLRSILINIDSGEVGASGTGWLPLDPTVPDLIGDSVCWGPPYANPRP